MSSACSHCNPTMVEIDKQLLGYLVVKSGVETLEEFEQLYKAQPEPKEVTVSFKPNMDLGEGEAPPEELKYRQLIILYHEQLVNKIKKLISSDEPISNQILEINKERDTVIENVKKIVTQTTTNRYNNGFKLMNTKLKKQKVQVNPMDKYQPRLETILLQQTTNVETIFYDFTGKVKQIILNREIASYYSQGANPANIKKAIAVPNKSWNACMVTTHTKYPKMNEDELFDYCEDRYYDDQIDNATNNTTNRLDMLGMYGYIQSDKAGYLQAGVIAQNGLSSGEILIAGASATVAVNTFIEIPWITMDDDSVCDDCLEAEANGPYSPFNYPDDMHYGERCYAGDPILVFA